MVTRNPNLLDMVAVLAAPADTAVEVGDVGTVVELLAPDAVEVEFLTRDGRTRAVVSSCCMGRVLALARVDWRPCGVGPPQDGVGCALYTSGFRQFGG